MCLCVCEPKTIFQKLSLTYRGQCNEQHPWLSALNYKNVNKLDVNEHVSYTINTQVVQAASIKHWHCIPEDCYGYSLAWYLIWMAFTLDPMAPIKEQ